MCPNQTGPCNAAQQGVRCLQKALGDYIDGPAEDEDAPDAANQLVLKSTGARIVRTPGISLFYVSIPCLLICAERLYSTK